MINLPLTGPEREALRQERAERILAEARKAAAVAGLSMKCSGQRLLSPVPAIHADDPGGCRNDGTGCLCRCHDRPPASGLSEEPEEKEINNGEV